MAKEKTDSTSIEERINLAYLAAISNEKATLTYKTLTDSLTQEFGENGDTISPEDENASRWTVTVGNISKKISGSGIIEPQTLISQGAKIGDYVNYNASSGDGANLQVTASDISEIVQQINESEISDVIEQNNQTDTSEKVAGGATISDTFKSSEITKWRIISIEDGIIKLMADTTTNGTVKFYGTEGFKKSVQVLDRISEIYGKGKGATGGKSITLKDIDLNYNNMNGDTSSYEYTSGKFFKQIIQNESVVDYENFLTDANNNEKVTIRGDCSYSYGGPNMFTGMDNSEIMWDIYSKTTRRILVCNKRH